VVPRRWPQSSIVPVLIIALIAFGLLAGWLGAFLLGARRRPTGNDIAYGLAGSFVGGLIASLLAGDGLELRMSGLLGSAIGAVVIMLVARLVSGRTA
jgi:uncharacterized membrane protein YeaQ/YmgE (transglycosylase-associated protein family)